MELTKSYEFFQPEKCVDRIHIIGCGAIGSTVAENLIRIGLKKINLYDFDKVEAHNIANQMYKDSDIGSSKVEALRKSLIEINPGARDCIKCFDKGYSSQSLSGYIFLCVDNIELRKQIIKNCEGNPYIKAVLDFRMRLTDAQHYAADWNDSKMVKDLVNSMSFTHEEAMKETPVSACNMTLSVAPTVRVICALGIANFMNFVKGEKLKKLILIDAFGFSLETF